MKIKIYIVTYDGEDHLRDNLNSLFYSDRFVALDVEVNIINNNTKFFLEREHVSCVNVLHNVLRPDFSTGHLARNWNQAIINGFKSLTEPDCDLLITIQDDAIWNNDWYATLTAVMEKYTFYTSGNGDAFCCYRPEAIRNIGLWDERYCNIGYHEYDYFLRAVIYNGDQSSINDIGDYHRNSWNPSPQVIQYVKRDAIKNENHLKSQQYHSISNKIYSYKWGFDSSVRDKSSDFWNWARQNVRGTVSPNFIFYPYFEKDVYDLQGKNYVI